MNGSPAVPACLLLRFASCGDKEQRLGKGFLLPAGNAERGKLAFGH